MRAAPQALLVPVSFKGSVINFDSVNWELQVTPAKQMSKNCEKRCFVYISLFCARLHNSMPQMALNSLDLSYIVIVFNCNFKCLPCVIQIV